MLELLVPFVRSGMLHVVLIIVNRKTLCFPNFLGLRLVSVQVAEFLIEASAEFKGGVTAAVLPSCLSK